MAGFRNFVTGEVLTAANVDDFLMKQSVQKYADAAARDAALGTAVAGGNALREGMVAWIDDDDELQAYDGTAWASVGNAGIGSNVVSTTKTDTFVTTFTSNTDRVAITGLTATITPTSATSKVLVTVNLQAAVTTDAGIAVLTRDGTEIARGDAEGVRGRQTAFIPVETITFESWAVGFSFLDSPATTSAITYGVDVGPGYSSTNTLYLNRTVNDSNTASGFRGISTITVIEVSS